MSESLCVFLGKARQLCLCAFAEMESPYVFAEMESPCVFLERIRNLFVFLGRKRILSFFSRTGNIDVSLAWVNSYPRVNWIVLENVNQLASLEMQTPSCVEENEGLSFGENESFFYHVSENPGLPSVVTENVCVVRVKVAV